MANFLEILPPYQMLKGLASALSAKKLQAEVEKEEESIRRRRSELMSLAEKETDISKKKVYLEQAINIKNYSLEALNKVLADAPTTKQILASAGETALMMTGGSALRLLKSGYKGVQSFKGAFKIGRFGSSENRAAMAADKLNQLITKSQKLEKFQNASAIGKTLQVGKSIASSTAEGAAFGALAETSINKDATTESILQSAGITAVLGGGLNVLGRGLGVGMKAYGEKVSPKVKELYKTIKTKIDDYAQGKELSKTSYDKVASSMDLNKSISRNIAKKTINFLDYSEKGVAKFFDRFDPIKRMEDAIYEAKGKPLTKQERVYVQTRLLNGRIDTKTNEELNKISKEVDAIFKGDSQLKKDSSVYLKALDDVDRARNGQLLEVVDGKSVSVSEEQAVKRLEDIYGDFVATNKIDLLERARSIYNRETNLELEKLRKAGILNDAQIAAMKEAHPNYIPHNVIFDKIEKSYIKSSLNVSESGIKKAFGSIRKIEDPWDAMVARRLLINRKVAQNNLMKSLTRNGETYGLDGFRPLQTSKSVELKNTFKKPKSGETTINLFNDGIKETWVVPEDIAIAIKGTDVIPPTGILKALSTVNKIFKQLTTQLNPEFAIPNLARDRQTMMLTADSIIQEMAIRTKVTPKEVNLSSKELQELWAKEGGIGANIYKDGDEAIFKELEKTGIVKFFKNAEDALSAISDISEQSTRLKVFEKALRSGLEPDVAALVARDATIDFAKMGTVMQTLNQVIPFLNARVQGFSNLGRVIKNNPEMFMRTQMLTSAYPAIALHKWNNQWDSYANISQEIKDKYWVIVHNEVETIDMNTGEKILIPQFITIPKAEGQVLAANPIQYYLERASVKDPRGVMEMIVDTIGSASPIEFQRFTHNNPLITAVSQFGPTGTLLAGGISGKDPFFGTDLVPTNKQGETVENYLKYKTSTPEYLKDISKIFANPDENGKSRGVNMSPAYLDFIINSAGGIPQVLSNITDLIYSAASGKDLSSKKTDTAFGTATQMPISRRIFREASPYYSPEAEGEKKYTKEVEKDIKTQSILSKEKIDNAAKDYLKAYNDKESFPDNESLIDYYNNYILGSYNMSDEERKSFIKEVNERVKGVASGSIGQINVNQSVDVRATLLLKKYWDILDSEGEEKAQAFWKEAQDKKILTKDVMRRINELQEDR